MAEPLAPPLKQILLDAYGVRVAVRSNDEALIGEATALLPPGWRPCAADRVEHTIDAITEDGSEFKVWFGEHPVAADADRELALGILDAQLRACVALHAPERIFVHAGVVAHRDRAILLPGPSFAGKTTLVMELIRAGATYFSDEYAVLDEDGLVHPYPRPLSVRAVDLSSTDHTPESLGATIGSQPLRVGAVVVTSYRPGAAWEPVVRTTGEAVLAVLMNTVPAQERPAESMRAISRAVEGAVAIESDRDEAAAVAPLILEQAGSRR